MENKKIKCSSEEDQDINAVIYCEICKIYMCDKCQKFHSKLFSSHKIKNLEEQKGEFFTGICKEPNHSNKLECFCKNHNVLCCIACTSKINKKGFGQHKDCDVCFIEEIREEKEKKLKTNIKYLEDMSETLQNSIDNLKIVFEKTIKNKEELNIKIKNTFSKIRTALNNKEEEILMEVNNLFNNILCDKKY